jgi:hypothetical protein
MFGASGLASRAARNASCTRERLLIMCRAGSEGRDDAVTDTPPTQVTLSGARGSKRAWWMAWDTLCLAWLGWLRKHAQEDFARGVKWILCHMRYRVASITIRMCGNRRVSAGETEQDTTPKGLRGLRLSGYITRLKSIEYTTMLMLTSIEP